MIFDGYELKKYICDALKDLNFNSFTEVQKSVLNEFDKDKNLLVKSKTGSGKTHAFLVPIFNNLDEKKNICQAVIISPTKELAMQIYKVSLHIASFSGDTINIKSSLIFISCKIFNDFSLPIITLVIDLGNITKSLTGNKNLIPLSIIILIVLYPSYKYS